MFGEFYREMLDVYTPAEVVSKLKTIRESIATFLFFFFSFLPYAVLVKIVAPFFFLLGTGFF